MITDSNNTLGTAVNDAVATLSHGGTLLYPTDTIWGLGCDACCPAAVERLYFLKRRDRSKSMLVLCSSMSMVERYVGRVGEAAAALLLSADRPTTVILPLQCDELAANLLADDGTIGVRIPRMEFCLRMLEAFGRPVVSTSANLSGQPSPACFGDIDPLLVASVDCCVSPSCESAADARSSRIVKLMPGGTASVLRE